MTMTTKKPVAEIAAEMGVGLVTPHLTCDGAADAIEFYKKAFGAEEMMKLPGPDGRLMHAAIRVNGAMVFMVDTFPAGEMHEAARSPKDFGGTPVTIHLMVDDADAVAAQAVNAGARIIMPVADQFWGDRYGIIEDPFGHRWSIATPVWPPRTPEEMSAAMPA